MSITQLTEYLLWKSIKHKTVHTTQQADIKLEFPINKQEIFENDMICRVCTNPAEIPITDKFEDTLIMSAIRAVANISIIEADYYPKYICKTCLGELKIAFQFKRKCEASDLAFRKAISSESMLITDTQPLVKHDFSLILHEMKEKRLAEAVAIKNDKTYNGDFHYEETSSSPPTESIQEITLPDNINLSQAIKKYDIYDDDYYNEELLSSLPPQSVQELAPPVDGINRQPALKRKKRKSTIARNRINTVHQYKSEKSKANNEIGKHIPRKKRKIQKIYKCKRCDLKFNTEVESQKHRKENSCVHQACPLCGKLVLNLTKHESIVHSRINKYTCHQCGKVYYSSGALKNHMHKHRETKEYYCEHCPYRGKRKSYLVCHMRVHTGEHRYLCSMCPLKFKNSSNLNKHQLIHFNKKFECRECKRQFRQEKHLKEHFDAAHLNIRYRCSICSKDICSRKKLLNHELRVHKREKHKLFEEVQRVVIFNDNE